MEIQNKHLKKIMEEMCNRVGADSKSVDVTTPEWFNDYSWTISEYESFVDWMVEYLYANSDARKTILTVSIKNKKYLRKAVVMFLLNYGWKIRQ